MGRGRPPKPTALKILAGNPGKRPLNTSEPKPLAAMPTCPDWLPKEAKAKWAELAPELHRLGLLTVIDGDVLAAYCSAWAEFVQATETLERDGRFVMVGGWAHETPATETEPAKTEWRGGQMQPHPAVAQQRSAWKAVKEFASLFGLDPSSRSKLHVQPPEPQDTGAVGARKRG